MSWLHGERILVEEITWRGRLEFGIEFLGETRPFEHQEFSNCKNLYTQDFNSLIGPIYTIIYVLTIYFPYGFSGSYHLGIDKNLRTTPQKLVVVVGNPKALLI